MNGQVGFAHKVVGMRNSGAHTGDGTSAATPMIAGMVATLNGVRYDHGLPPLGFINPLLYHHAPSVSVANAPFRDTTTVAAGREGVAMFDITRGRIDGCTGTGYYSTIGWDPATGLGIPNYPALKKIVTSMKMMKKKRTTKGASKHQHKHMRRAKGK
jgi:subtilase family serine protease